MVIWEEIRPALDVALNEATLLGFEVNPTQRIAGATFSVLTLPANGPPPADCRVQMLFRPVGRIAASLRMGIWNDETADVISFQIDELLQMVESFGGRPIYGWEFFDVHEKELSRWGNKLSLDWCAGSDGLSRSITVFQESGGRARRHLDLCVWFDEIEIRRPDGTTLSLEEFAAGGNRWWDGLYSGDKRTQGHGILPAK